ncbi:hypothetical protein ACQP60_04290 [Isoptericola variabilis]|uniref:hypothetical protein n=1 Tax=Isoptericola variabilis TaxID=139208 RepID=UPI003D21DBBE
MRIELAWRQAAADVDRRVSALEDARAEVGPRWVRGIAVALLTIWLSLTAADPS